MKNNITSPSTRIAKEMAKIFGDKYISFSVEIKHRQVIGNFVRKIEKAHQQAAKSTQLFLIHQQYVHYQHQYYQLVEEPLELGQHGTGTQVHVQQEHQKAQEQQ